MWYLMLAAVYAAGFVGALNITEEDGYSKAGQMAFALFWPAILPLVGVAQMFGMDDDEAEDHL
jgi:hypothetical protein